jgi:hypothetical protein
VPGRAPDEALSLRSEPVQEVAVALASSQAAGAPNEWLVKADWNALGTHGTKDTVADMEACLSKAKGHALFSYAQDSSHCYTSDGTSFGGRSYGHVTSGCVATKVRNCAALPGTWFVKAEWNALGTHGKKETVADLAACISRARDGHAQFSFAHDSNHCYTSDEATFGGSHDGSVTSGCVPSKVQHCGTVPPAPARWPSFPSLAALRADPWARYYQTVYGELPSTFPLDVGSAWMIYELAITAASVSDIPPVVGRCPMADVAGERYTLNNAYQPAAVSFAWHPYPYARLAAHTYVEVMRQADPFVRPAPAYNPHVCSALANPHAGSAAGSTADGSADKRGGREMSTSALGLCTLRAVARFRTRIEHNIT